MRTRRAETAGMPAFRIELQAFGTWAFRLAAGSQWQRAPVGGPTVDAVRRYRLAPATAHVATAYGCATPYPDRLQALRQVQAQPLLAALRHWLEAMLLQVSAKSELAGAIKYTLVRREALTRYCAVGRKEIDNNSIERSIRLLATKQSLCTS